MDKRICFMGTPDFGAKILSAMIDGGFPPVLVVSQPDKPSGRGRKIKPTPVKEVALEAGIEVLQPESARKKSFIDWFEEQNFDLNVVVAYGQVLPPRLLDAPNLGSINVHTSLLPKWRGCAPIRWAILAGDETTGISVQKMVRELDAGPLYARKEVNIEEHDDVDTMFEKLENLGVEVLMEVLPKILADELEPMPQEEWDETYAHMLSKEHGKIDWTKTATEIKNQVRALHIWPSITLVRPDGEEVKIHDVEIITQAHFHKTRKFVKDALNVNRDAQIIDRLRGKPGEVIFVSKTELWIASGDENLSIKVIQPVGKNKMNIADYLRGRSIEVGSIWLPKDFKKKGQQ